jgi:hypothetical protein
VLAAEAAWNTRDKEIGYWEFDDLGFVRRRKASINDVPIAEADRRILAPREGGDTSGIPLQ